MTPVLVRNGGRSPFHVSWGALFAGAIAALGVWVLLYSLGLALGLSTVDPNDTDTVRRTGIFTGLWGLVAPLVALFIGGLVAGRSAGPLRRGSGALHGLIVWSLTALGGLVLVANMFGGALGSAVSVGTNVASKAIADKAVGSPEEATPAATPGEGVVGEVNEAIGRVQAKATENIKQGAVEAAPETGTAFWVVFGALLLGALAAMAGGAAGVSREQRSLANAEVVAGTGVATVAAEGRTTLTGVPPVPGVSEGEVAELRSEIAQLRLELRDLMQSPPHVHH
jgi:hypothetical protein